jgi:hypothetical protein
VASRESSDLGLYIIRTVHALRTADRALQSAIFKSAS